MTAPEEEWRVQDAVRRHARTRAFAEAEDVISAVLSDPRVEEARKRVQAAETELGMELCARLSRSRTATTKPWRRATRPGSPASVGASTAAGDGSAVLPDGHETSMEEPHWGRNGEGRPIAWVGSIPSDW
ncbi:hypothetical protein OG481_31320 [Streptomyces longwoodensis]|uniref:hypothetical protein n=1 Tax=Streptomyces longwoodensis TaxID=68231 RepID=UPI002DD7E21C|nr:hypothetical protein [Streptomyces longwoodensis]WRY92708.1 hypothetical protein OG481_31320 [Streptomyces longwoodensis]